MHSLSPKQLGALIAAARQNHRDTLMIALAVEHGLRATEVCQLRLQDFDTSTGTVYLTVQRLKGSRKTRQPLLAATQAKVLAWSAGKRPGDYLFPGRKPGQHVTRVTFWRVFKHHCRATGVIPAHLSPHALKHTTALLGLDGGMKVNEVQRYLGHVSGASTLRYLTVNDAEASCAFRNAFTGSKIHTFEHKQPYSEPKSLQPTPARTIEERDKHFGHLVVCSHSTYS